MSETRFFEQQDGTKIAYKIFKSENAKSEVPIVLIAGVGSVKEYYLGFEEELAKKQQVIVFDNRGMGESTVASYNDPITIELMAQDAIALIKHLGIKRFNLFGINMGARISFAVALSLPSDLKLEKLVITSCAPRIDITVPAFQGIEKIYNSPSFPLPKTIQEQKDGLLKNEYDKSLAKYLLEHPDKLDKVAEVMFNANKPFEMMKRQWEAVKTYELLPRGKEIKVPTLIIHGEEDIFFTIKDAELLDQELPNSKLHNVPNAGNNMFIMECEAANVISEFLNN